MGVLSITFCVILIIVLIIIIIDWCISNQSVWNHSCHGFATLFLLIAIGIGIAVCCNENKEGGGAFSKPDLFKKAQLNLDLMNPFDKSPENEQHLRYIQSSVDIKDLKKYIYEIKRRNNREVINKFAEKFDEIVYKKVLDENNNIKNNTEFENFKELLDWMRINIIGEQYDKFMTTRLQSSVLKLGLYNKYNSSPSSYSDNDQQTSMNFLANK